VWLNGDPTTISVDSGSSTACTSDKQLTVKQKAQLSLGKADRTPVSASKCK